MTRKIIFFKEHHRDWLRFVYLILFIRLLDTDIENSDSEPYLLSDSYLTASPHVSNTEAICDSDLEVVGNASQFDENQRFLCFADVEVDPVCRRLDKLVRDGYISKVQIFYKYLDNMTQIYYNSKHPYNKDVVEFFASTAQHGEESTYNIVRGPMGFGNKQNSSKEIRKKLNEAGIETLR